MSDVNQIVATTLLNNISRVYENNRSSMYSKSSSNSFSNILDDTLNTLVGSNGVCSCSGIGELGKLLMLTTFTGYLNNVKLDVAQNNNLSNNTSNNDIANNTNISSTASTTSDSTASTKMNDAMKLLEAQIGKKYVWGANGPDSFDCSGLTRYIYKNALGKDIPRVSYEQSKTGQAIDKENLKPGDLVFFDTMGKGRVSHVGIYVGNDEFIHASNARDGVKKSNLSSSYYQKTYRGARRP